MRKLFTRREKELKDQLSKTIDKYIKLNEEYQELKNEHEDLTKKFNVLDYAMMVLTAPVNHEIAEITFYDSNTGEKIYECNGNIEITAKGYLISCDMNEISLPTNTVIINTELINSYTGYTIFEAESSVFNIDEKVSESKIIATMIEYDFIVNK